MSGTPDPIFSARVERALGYRAVGDAARFQYYCRGLRALYRQQRKSFVVEENHPYVAFTLLDPRTHQVFARRLHRDPVLVKLVMPGR